MQIVLLLYPVIVLFAVFSISFFIIYRFVNPHNYNFLVGKRYISETIITDQAGIIEVEGKNVAVKSCGGTILKGMPVLVVGYLYEEDIYLVEKFV